MNPARAATFPFIERASPKIIEETRQYIRNFDRAAATTPTARGLYNKTWSSIRIGAIRGERSGFRRAASNRDLTSANNHTVCRISTAKRAAGQEIEDKIMLSPRQLEAAFHGEKQTQTNP